MAGTRKIAVILVADIVPILTELRRTGMTDYVVLPVPFSDGTNKAFRPLGMGVRLGPRETLVEEPGVQLLIALGAQAQCGHGQGSTRGASGVISGCFRASTAGGSAPSSARAVAMLSARLALARSP